MHRASDAWTEEFHSPMGNEVTANEIEDEILFEGLKGFSPFSNIKNVLYWDVYEQLKQQDDDYVYQLALYILKYDKKVAELFESYDTTPEDFEGTAEHDEMMDKLGAYLSKNINTLTQLKRSYHEEGFIPAECRMPLDTPCRRSYWMWRQD